MERLIGRTSAGSRLSRLIEQAGASTSPGAIVVSSVICGAIAGFLTYVFLRIPLALFVCTPLGAGMPFLWLLQRRSSRLKKFEEQFPDALDLVSRAIRAGHAFQAAIGMAADELAAPTAPEFRKVFDQQNFGLPLKDALNALAERVPLVDVKFFVTAVAIQRDTGGNLAEILDGLAHVVRERFKIQRQVRVHTAHGRITGFVPACATGVSRGGAVHDQQRTHAAVVRGTDRPIVDPGHHCHAARRLRVDPKSDQDRGVA